MIDNKSESSEKEILIKEIDGVAIKENTYGGIFQTPGEKTNSQDYQEVFFNSKNFDSNTAKTQNFLINNTKSLNINFYLF